MSSDGMTLQNMGAGGGLAINALGATSEYGLMTANANRPSENDLLLGVGASWNGDSVAQIDFRAGADETNKDDGKIMFYTQTSSGGGLVERMRISEDGKAHITPGGALSGSHPPGDLNIVGTNFLTCLLYTSPSPRDRQKSRMPSSA